MVCRAIPHRISTIEELALPDVVRELAEEERGIVLLTGTTGSGKSTTLAAMIDHMNNTMSKHIVTIEDPIEFVHDGQALGDQPARSRHGHRVLQARPAPRAAPGPRRDPGRRDARRGDRPDRAVRGRDRPPRALDDPHGRRDRVDQPHARLLPAPPAPAGAQHDRRHRQGRHLPAPRARRRRRPRGRLRDPAHDRPRPRHDPRPRPDGQTRRGHHRAAATTACRPSTRRCSATSRPAA